MKEKEKKEKEMEEHLTSVPPKRILKNLKERRQKNEKQ